MDIQRIGQTLCRHAWPPGSSQGSGALLDFAAIVGGGGVHHTAVHSPVALVAIDRRQAVVIHRKRWSPLTRNPSRRGPARALSSPDCFPTPRWSRRTIENFALRSVFVYTHINGDYRFNRHVHLLRQPRRRNHHGRRE
jgi:hypothetical protein